MSFNDEDWKIVLSNLGPGDNVEIFVIFGHGLIVKETAVYLTMEVESSSTYMEVEASTDLKTNLSLEGKVLQTSPVMEMKSSLKSNRSNFTRFAKRMCQCLCLNNFLLNMPLS